MSEPRAVAVYGAGGHGKVVADILSRLPGFRVIGFIDDGRPPGTAVLGLRVLGGAAWLGSEEARGVAVALGVGDNRARERVTAACRSSGVEIVSAVHPSAVVSPSALIGAGSVVMALAAVNPDARIGEGCIVNTGAVIEHDCVLGDFAHVSPNAALGGAAQLGARSHLGLGAVILPGVRVGSSVTVGAGAVVTREVEDGVVVVGVPARVRRPIA